MYRVGVLELVGYREWTEGLGADREWMIQVIQSRMYGELSAAAASIEGYVIPLRYDYMIVLDAGLEADGLRAAASSASRLSPVPVKLSAACAETPLAAQAKASSAEIYEPCEVDPLAAVHIDVDDVTSKTAATSPYRTFGDVMSIFCEVMKAASALGGLSQYLGGDNMVAFLPPGSVPKILGLVEELGGLKAGVGVHRSPRRAIALAAARLSEIRARRASP